MLAVKFEVVPAINGKVECRVYGVSGGIILISQPFQHREACYEWIRTVKEHGSNDKLVHLKGEAGKLGLTLKAPNHKVVLEAGPYATPEDRDAAIASLRAAKSGAVVDKI